MPIVQNENILPDIQFGFRFLFFTIWNWDRMYYSIEGGPGPRQNYGTVEKAKAEIDRRLADDAKEVSPRRVTDYPAAA